MPSADSFRTRDTLSVDGQAYEVYRVDRLPAAARLPYTLKILLENLLRNEDGRLVERADIETALAWNAQKLPDKEIPFIPSRVLLQDFTGVPVVADLAAMRDAAGPQKASRVNPLVPVDLVIDHSVQVDAYGSPDAFRRNVEREYERNTERYAFLRWAQGSFQNLRVVPPGTGIVHQVNLEYLASVVTARDGQAFPDTLIGTDSHTTMINGLGVLGWGVGGIEAEAAMLGQPMYMLLPEVVGFKLTGKLPEGATATDVVLTATQMLRKKGVVGKFVEFHGPGLDSLSLPDRATLANMAPEYGATCGFFPVDAETLNYLRLTGRPTVLVEAYAKLQGLWRDAYTPDPLYTSTLELDLATVVPSLAGPKRPQDLVTLKDAKASFAKSLTAPTRENGFGLSAEQAAAANNGLKHGSVVIAAITSCTNTSNPALMLAAGLLAKKAVERGLAVPAHVKTSLAPGSRVVTDYLDRAGLTPYLDRLRFNLVGYGCTTCIGNSGPLPQEVESSIKGHNLVAAAVLSGNRNFEGRIHPLVKAAYLASPPLVVAYALAGRVDFDPFSEPLQGGVYLKDLWPSVQEVRETVAGAVDSKMFTDRYGKVFEGDLAWRGLAVPEGERYAWPESTYIRKPPYFDLPNRNGGDLTGARVLAILGDSVTTDHISPAGDIAADGPAARYLQEHAVQKPDFNSYGARRGNHEVMVRGTFANVRLKNLLAPGTEGGVTIHLPSGKPMSIFDAAMEYAKTDTPLVILAGKEYGSGSSRDWAAKGPALQGVRAVIAESYERIHRSNLVGMGVLPLEFLPGQNRETLGLTGQETFSILGLGRLSPRCTLKVRADGREFEALARIDTKVEVEYYKNGGILQTVLAQLVR
jgi:aconitate hydratase